MEHLRGDVEALNAGEGVRGKLLNEFSPFCVPQFRMTNLTPTEQLAEALKQRDTCDVAMWLHKIPLDNIPSDNYNLI